MEVEQVVGQFGQVVPLPLSDQCRGKEDIVGSTPPDRKKYILKRFSKTFFGHIQCIQSGSVFVKRLDQQIKR